MWIKFLFVSFNIFTFRVSEITLLNTLQKYEYMWLAGRKLLIADVKEVKY